MLDYLNSSASFSKAGIDLFIISKLTQYDILTCPEQPNPDPGTSSRLYFVAALANSTSSGISALGNR